MAKADADTATKPTLAEVHEELGNLDEVVNDAEMFVGLFRAMEVTDGTAPLVRAADNLGDLLKRIEETRVRAWHVTGRPHVELGCRRDGGLDKHPSEPKPEAPAAGGGATVKGSEAVSPDHDPLYKRASEIESVADDVEVAALAIDGAISLIHGDEPRGLGAASVMLNEASKRLRDVVEEILPSRAAVVAEGAKRG